MLARDEARHAEGEEQMILVEKVERCLGDTVAEIEDGRRGETEGRNGDGERGIEARVRTRPV